MPGKPRPTPKVTDEPRHRGDAPCRDCLGPVTRLCGLPGVLIAALLGLGVLSGCTDGSAPDRATTASPREVASDVTEVQPGSPGEPNQTLGTGAAMPVTAWNDDDVNFMEMMIPHHRQALDMAELARARAQDPQVLAVADRIDAAQAPEILVMADWLTDHDLEVPSGDDLHHAMVGMLSDEQMAELAGAAGATFDRLFLTGMIQHHEGAVAMALDVMNTGEDLRVNELANDVNAGQTAEIVRLQRLLDRL